VILPASPSFYSFPDTLDALVDTVVARIMDQLGVEQTLVSRWGQ
jgi:4-hydroxy-3-polyprenylbenzoate decarboxylase